MKRKYDGWIARGEKEGDWWFGTFCKDKWGAKAHVRDIKSGNKLVLKIVKVKLVEVKDVGKE